MVAEAPKQGHDLPPGVVQGEVVGAPHIEMAPEQRLNFPLLLTTVLCMWDTNHKVRAQLQVYMHIRRDGVLHESLSWMCCTPVL